MRTPHSEQCAARPRDSLSYLLFYIVHASRQGNSSAGHYPIGNVPKGLIHLINKDEA
jgi:hypothetical protein